MPIDLSKYVNPGNPIPQVDLAAGLRWLGEQNMQRQRMAQQQSQFETFEGRANREHSDQVAHQQRVESDVNSRFALEMDQQENLKNQELKVNQSKKRLALTAEARTAVAQGDWNTAHALAGTLADLGTRVDITQNPDGSPNFRFENPEDSYQDNQSFEGIMGRINGQRNPFEQLPGQYQAPQPQSNLTQPQQQLSQDLNQSADAINSAQGQPSAVPPTESQPNSSDPRMLNSATLQQQNEMRLNPVLSGIEDALPQPWNAQISPFMQGLKSLRMSPEATLAAGQKPFETIASLYRAKDAADAASGRASASQSRAESSDARQRQFHAETAARQIDEGQLKISESVANIHDFDLIRTAINSGNRNAQADAIKKMIKMVEGSRITDRDFDIAKTGIASNWEQALMSVQRIYKDGLLPEEQMRFNQMLDQAYANFERKIMYGRDALKKMVKSYRFEPERLGVSTYLNSRVPVKYWDDEMKSFDATSNQGGIPSGSTPSTRSSTSNSYSRRGTASQQPIPDTDTTTDGVENPVKDINSEADEFLNSIQ
jgi:hypothetical protein